MTLVELILVMIVIFVMAGVVAPRFSDFFPSLQVGTTADRLYAWARKARSDAALTGLRHRLVIDPARKEFWIAYEARPLKEPGTYVESSWGRESVPDDVVFESLQGFGTDGGRFLEFRPDGTTKDATVVVSNPKGDRRTIKVTGATSRIAFEAPEEP